MDAPGAKFGRQPQPRNAVRGHARLIGSIGSRPVAKISISLD
jgi:hypothetical protein